MSREERESKFQKIFKKKKMITNFCPTANIFTICQYQFSPVEKKKK